MCTYLESHRHSQEQHHESRSWCVVLLQLAASPWGILYLSEGEVKSLFIGKRRFV